MNFPSYEQFLYLQKIAMSDENRIDTVRFSIDDNLKGYELLLTLRLYQINTEFELNCYLVEDDIRTKLYDARIEELNPISCQTYENALQELHEKLLNKIRDDKSRLNLTLSFLKESYHNLKIKGYMNGVEDESKSE